MRGKKTFQPLTRKGDFKKVFELGSKFSSRFFVLYALPNGLAFSRLGLSVSKKIGGAVIRNRVKRRLREAVRRRLQEQPLQCDVIIVARHASLEADFSDLEKRLSRIFSGLVHEKTIDSGNTVI